MAIEIEYVDKKHNKEDYENETETEKEEDDE